MPGRCATQNVLLTGCHIHNHSQGFRIILFVPFLCVCVCVCMFIHMCMYECMHALIWVYVCIWPCELVWVCVCVCVCPCWATMCLNAYLSMLCVNECTCVCVCMNACVCVCVCVCVYLSECMCLSVCMCVSVCVYVNVSLSRGSVECPRRARDSESWLQELEAAAVINPSAGGVVEAITGSHQPVAPSPRAHYTEVGLLDYGRNHIMIFLVNIEITIIQTIIFEFERMMYLFSMSLPKTLCNWELWIFALKKYTKWWRECSNQKWCIQLFGTFYK